jgi:hypothetical protein
MKRLWIGNVNQTKGSVNMSRELDFTAAWNDGMALLKAHREAALAIAGVFIFLPQLIFGFLFPQPEFNTTGDSNAVFAQLIEFYKSIMPWLLLISVFSGIGNLAITFMAINARQPAAGEAIVLGAKHYVTMLVAGLLSGFAIGIGLVFLIVPGIYLAIKFCLASTVVAAEEQLNPITALSRSWQITKGNSLRIFGFLLVIGIVGGIAALLFNMLFAGIGLVLPGSAGMIVTTLGSAISATVLAVIVLFILIGIYRQLSTPA